MRLREELSDQIRRQRETNPGMVNLLARRPGAAYRRLGAGGGVKSGLDPPGAVGQRGVAQGGVRRGIAALIRAPGAVAIDELNQIPGA